MIFSIWLIHLAWYCQDPFILLQRAVLLLFLCLSSIPLYTCTSSLSKSSIEGHSSCFHVFAIVNKTATNTKWIQGYVYIYKWMLYNFSNRYPEEELLCEYTNSILNFKKSLPSPSFIHLLCYYLRLMFFKVRRCQGVSEICTQQTFDKNWKHFWLTQLGADGGEW